MKRGLLGGSLAWLLVSGLARADGPSLVDPGPAALAQAPVEKPAESAKAEPVAPDQNATVSDLRAALEENAKAIKALKEEYAREIERQRKQSELQQKQIEVLERTSQLLAEQLKLQAPNAAAVEDLQAKAAVTEAREKQANRRDVELANATDELRERVDYVARNPAIPYTARELYLPYQT